MMGFYNYSIGLGVALVGVGFWLRLDRSRRALPGFAASALVLIFSHPVPVALLLAFIAADLLRRSFFMQGSGSSRFRRNQRQLAAFAVAAALAVYPALAFNTAAPASSQTRFGFHYDWLRTTLLLTGLSPYNTRSHGLPVNAYRVTLYILLAATTVWALRAFRREFASRHISASGGLFVSAVLFALLLPFLPGNVSGGGFFNTRLIILVWILMILAASGRQVQGHAFSRACIAAGIIFTVLTLWPAERIFRPMAESVSRIEQVRLPAHTSALLLDGPMLNPMLRYDYDVAFNPFVWANALPLVREDDLVLNAPWLQLSSFPLRIAPGAAVSKDASAIIELVAKDPPPRLTGLLPKDRVEEMIGRSSIVMYTGIPRELKSGLVDFLGSEDASRFTCSYLETWSLLCLRNQSPEGM